MSRLVRILAPLRRHCASARYPRARAGSPADRRRSSGGFSRGQHSPALRRFDLSRQLRPGEGAVARAGSAPMSATGSSTPPGPAITIVTRRSPPRASRACSSQASTSRRICCRVIPRARWKRARGIRSAERIQLERRPSVDGHACAPRSPACTRWRTIGPPRDDSGVRSRTRGPRGIHGARRYHRAGGRGQPAQTTSAAEIQARWGGATEDTAASTGTCCSSGRSSAASQS